MARPNPARGDGRGVHEADVGVTGVFRDPGDASRAVRRLTAESVPAHSIRVLVIDERGTRRRELEVEDEAGALKGALIGAGIGAIVGLLIVVLVPVLSASASAGALGVSTFVGALRAIALCAVAGVPLGVILGMGRWQGRKKIAETGLAPHRIHVAVESEELATLARGVLEEAGAERVDGHDGTAR